MQKAQQTPMVSVVIPTHNRPRLLERALASVAEQTFRDFEIIVVDDCSQQSPIEIVERFARASLIRHRTNRGGSAARNTGIKAATGSYVALLDDDDTWEPAKLAEQVAALERAKSETAMCYTWCVVVDDSTGNLLQEWDKSHEGGVLDELLQENFITSASVMVRREVFDHVGLFDETFPSCQDWEMWVRIAKEYEVICVPKKLAVAHQHPGVRVGTSTGALEGYEKLIEKFAPLYKGREARLAKHLESIGYSHLRNGNPGRAATYLQRAVAIWPWSWKCWVKWCWAQSCRATGPAKAADR